MIYGAREPSLRLHDQMYNCAWFLLVFLLSYCAVVIKFIAAPGSVMASPGPVLGRFDRFDQIGPRTLRGPALEGVPFCTVRYKIGESAKS